MLASTMPRLRRRRNYVLAALLLTSLVYLTLSRRDDLLARVMTTEDGSSTFSPGTEHVPPVPPVYAKPPPPPGIAVGDKGGSQEEDDEEDDKPPAEEEKKPKEEAEKPKEVIKAEDLLKEDSTPLSPSRETSQKLMADIPMSYGTASRPGLFSDMTKHGHGHGVADLPDKYLPSRTSPEKRLIIIGDVHGQLGPLKLLLEKLSFDEKKDHVIFTGDMISKGPDSAGVVQLAMDVGASAVRGNHEDRVLLAQRQQEEAAARRGDDKEAGSWFASLLETRDGSSSAPPPPPAEPSPGTEADVAVASRLDRKHLKWLASLPIILRLGPFAATSNHKPWNAGTVAVVHAGLVPGVALEKQDLRAAMNMRSLVYPAQDVRRELVKEQLEEEMKAKMERTSRGRKVEGTVEIKKEWVDDELRRLEREEGFETEKDKRVWFPVDGREGEAWSEVWSREQIKLEEDGVRVVVVYGHDAKAGLRVGDVEIEVEVEGGKKEKKKKKKGERYAFGLDSGCVYGNQLSAMVLEMDEERKGVRHRVVQVGCEKAVELMDTK